MLSVLLSWPHPVYADKQAALEEWNSQRLQNAWHGFLFAVGGWIVISVLQMIIGWIVRGFAGIPWGHDHRPEPLK